MELTFNWVSWAVLSALFAAITAVLLKLGVEEIEPDIATLIPTAVIGIAVAGYVYATGTWTELTRLSGRTWCLLMLAGLSTGASWLFYVRALKVGEVSRVV